MVLSVWLTIPVGDLRTGPEFHFILFAEDLDTRQKYFSRRIAR
jgi:hypothetical protein